MLPMPALPLWFLTARTQHGRNASGCTAVLRMCIHVQMEEQEVEVTEADVLRLLAHAADEPHGFEAHQEPAGAHSLRVCGCVELTCGNARRLPRMQAMNSIGNQAL